ncbi:Rieske 2Fe-2S domain-containing protein [Paracoccus rhizosphaerae]|uniref:Rieske 2Fe-2S domain-containing protein n=1 Tax=Paracoccus rhizosphaerae TaxID=1133347 RepID=A0ABV6CNP2_9RHOB|nr:Rieske 2Fe-2S domain-containing protein [Paracoccus rhizosphaerae]
MTSLTERFPAALEAAEQLDAPAYAVADVVSTVLEVTGTASQPIQNVLHGTWLGHPLHPILATVPVGTWTMALALDGAEALGLAPQRRLGEAADLALKVGVAGAVVASAAGLADWRQIHGRDRRTGLGHAALNSAALGLTVGSLALRRKGRRGIGRAASGAGWLALAAGAYLGGHLVYRRRVGVDQADRSPEPRGFQPVLPVAALQEDRPRRVEVWDEAARAMVGVVLVLHRGQVHAMGSRCSHMGGPLDEGWVQNGGLVCPWHGSRYCLATGRVLDGPSTSPQPRYDVRISGDQIEIRHVPEPGDEALTPEEVDAGHAYAVAGAGALPEGRKADEVLFEHHQLLRRLFETIEGMQPDDPERRDMMRLLAGELEIHEHVEDAIFYPAVRPVSEDVPVAHAEHQQLADMLAVTLRLGTSSPEFEQQLRALHQAVDHHASSEEESMFKEAQRLGEARLRELGQQIEEMLEHERVSRARSAFRALKIRLLEGA